MLSQSADLQSSAAFTPLRTSTSHKAPDQLSELKLIRKLYRLSRVSWSPTLRANTEALKSREIELQREASNKKQK